MTAAFANLGLALTLIFVITLLALLLQLFYSLRRRPSFHRQVIATSVGADQLVLHACSNSYFSSKELLYFFCIRLRPQSQIESASITSSRSAVHHLNSNPQLDVDRTDVDMFKLQGIFGPPRFLFTIKEEEKEDLESPADKSPQSVGIFANKVEDMSRNSARSLEESFNSADDAKAVVVDIDHGIDATPFSTPCASPSCFTPTESPVHESGYGR